MENKNNLKQGQKNFYFEDYEYSDNIKNVIRSGIQVSVNRISFIFFIFVVIAFIYSFKIIYLGLINKENYFINKSYYKELIFRQTITDTNGSILAKTIPLYNAAIRSELISDKKKLLINLKIIFPKLNIEKVKKKINNEKYFYIKKRLKKKERYKLWALGDKSINIENMLGRVYPHRSLFSHVIGQIDDNNTGISGIEKSYDNNLKNLKKPLSLTVDSNLQYLIKQELLNAQKIFNPIGSAALLMNVNNGEILSLISLPDFDLNERKKIEDKIYLNKITKGVYELGSVWKTFTVAAGLEHKVIKPSMIFKKLPKNIICGKRTIGEYDNNIPRNLSVEQILIRSSNVGSIKIARKIGEKKLRNFYRTLNLVDKIDFDLEEVGKPLPMNWGNCTLETVSYGHGITTTPIQLARAYATLVNGGYKIYPTIVKKNFTQNKKEQIISKETSGYMRDILRKVVSKEEGTANWGEIPGYEVGGKTGTAEKYNSDEQINTFISFFPSSKPTHILVVILDEPKPAPDYVYTFRFENNYKSSGYKKNTAGWNSVVIAGKIIEKIGPILAIKNLQSN
jgi:cell division protein FtsI (penicillin-binding protein 3)|tara:strand:+ start:2152 stop:3849 length:1698 start_codon:yes stop_codon:yes gene_type:complete